MHGRCYLTDKQAERVLCAIEFYLSNGGERIPHSGRRAVLAAKREVERVREDILTRRIRAGLTK